ncbi:hypothetical protein [Puniceibacterium sediminis]|uniref:hypothetical protein n=1 Tax=Puniceibacterium sediminis TaxID=1608407 RepID=UPI001FE43511|nr:hypothetical protein [Puniceibacterium sediminis]
MPAVEVMEVPAPSTVRDVRSEFATAIEIDVPLPLNVALPRAAAMASATFEVTADMFATVVASEVTRTEFTASISVVPVRSVCAAPAARAKPTAIWKFPPTAPRVAVNALLVASA